MVLLCDMKIKQLKNNNICLKYSDYNCEYIIDQIRYYKTLPILNNLHWSDYINKEIDQTEQDILNNDNNKYNCICIDCKK